MGQIHKIANTVEKRHTVHRRVYPCQTEKGYIHTHTETYTHIYIHIKREREKNEAIYGIEWQALKWM